MIYLLSIFLLPFLCFAQSNLWYLTRGYDQNDNAWGVAVNTCGNIYWATNEIVPPSLYHDIFIYKIDSTGQQLWKSQSWGGPFGDLAFIVMVKEPYVYIGGRTDDTAGTFKTGDLLLLAYRMESDTLALEWEYTWDQAGGYEELDGIVVEEDGIYISGWTTPDTSYAVPPTDIVVQKLDLNGNLIWSNTWGGTGFEGANGHMVVDTSNIYIVSHYGNLFLGNALLIAFSRDSGNYLWDITWGGLANDDFYGLAMSSDSFLYAVGPTASFGDSTQLSLVKYTRAGVKVWEKIWGGSGNEFGRAIITDGDSIVYIAANTTSYGAGDKDIVLLKYDSIGTLLSYKTWGGSDLDGAHDIAMAGDYLYITGRTKSFGAGEEDALLLKVNGRTMEFPDTLGLDEKAIFFDTGTLKVSPNPFISPTSIRYSVARVGQVELKIYSLTGQLVKTLVDGYQKAGNYTVKWDGKDENGKLMPSGLYFVKLKVGEFSQAKKLLLLLK